MKRTLVLATFVAVGCLAFLLTRFNQTDQRRNARPQVLPARSVTVDGRPEKRGDAKSVVVRVEDTDVDVTSIIERTHFAFSRVDGAYVGGDQTYGVRVRQSRIEITPELADNLQPKSKSLSLETQSLRRGKVDLRPSTFEVDEDGHLVAALGESGATEELRNTRSGLEQFWRFDEQPGGTGDLEVEVNANGQELVAVTDSGLHFRDADAGLGLVYSHATWIDADGRTSDIKARYEQGRIRFTVPAAVIEDSIYPAVLDPTVGAETSVDTPAPTSASDVQRAPAIGHSGAGNNDFLVVWQDRRRSLNSTYDIFGAHVNRSGTVLDNVGFLISPRERASEDETVPVVRWAADVSDYIIVYACSRGGFPSICGTTLPTDSSKIPSTELILEQGDSTHSFSSPALLILNNKMLMAWREVNPATGIVRIKGQFFTTGFALIGASFDIATGGTGDDFNLPAIAGQSTVLPDPLFFVVWQTNIPCPICGTSRIWNIQGRWYRFSDGGATSFIPTWISQDTSHHTTNPAVDTFGGFSSPYTGWVVAYMTRMGTVLNPNYDIYARCVSPGGAVMGVFTISSFTRNQMFPAVGGHGQTDTQVFVTWQTNQDNPGVTYQVRGARVNVNSSFILSSPDAWPSVGLNMAGAADTAAPAATHSDDIGKYFTTWGDFRNSMLNDIYGATTTWSGTVEQFGGFLISKSASKEISPAIRKCAGNYLVAWSDDRNGYSNADIYGTILNSSGGLVASGFQISGASGRQDSPAISCNGSNFFVVWVDERNGNPDIYGNGVNATTGALLNGSSGVQIAGAAEPDDQPSIAYDGISTTPSYWVVYQWNSQIIRGQRVDKNGALIGTAVTISATDGSVASSPDIDFDGSNFLVVWQNSPATGGQADIVGASLTPAGSPGAPFTIENNAAMQRYPRVRFDATGGVSTVVYEDDRNLGTAGIDVYGRRVTTPGVVQAAFAVASTANHETAPRLAMRSGSLQEVVYTSAATTVNFNFDVVGQSLNAGATSGAAFTVSGATGVREMTPGIDCLSSTNCMGSYRWFNPDDGTTDSDRVKIRTLTYP